MNVIVCWFKQTRASSIFVKGVVESYARAINNNGHWHPPTSGLHDYCLTNLMQFFNLLRRGHMQMLWRLVKHCVLLPSKLSRVKLYYWVAPTRTKDTNKSRNKEFISLINIWVHITELIGVNFHRNNFDFLFPFFFLSVLLSWRKSEIVPIGIPTSSMIRIVFEISLSSVLRVKVCNNCCLV